MEKSLYRSILVPLDGTEVDQVIIDHLLQLGKIHGSKIYMMRVIHSHTRDSLRHETETAEKYLDKKEAMFQGEGISAEKIIEYGEPENLIIEKAAELEVDLIAMATHGHGWLVDILFGSVAHKVRHTVSIPVLMIRGKQ